MDRDALARAVRERDWYHTLELAPGVVTPGWFDTRELARRLPLPASLAGRRCLDVGTFDGFWAFEMERRGAAEVVAIDLLDPAQWDWPPGSEAAAREAIGARKGRGEGFVLAHEALGSSVQRLELGVHDLDQAAHGEFDFVYLGSLLLHLRDPVGALARVRSVCRGELLVVDAVDPGLGRRMRRPAMTLDAVGRPWWFRPNPAGLRRMVEAGGFAVVDGPRGVRVPRGAGRPVPRPRPALLRSRAGREELLATLRGEPHAAVLARAA